MDKEYGQETDPSGNGWKEGFKPYCLPRHCAVAEQSPGACELWPDPNTFRTEFKKITRSKTLDEDGNSLSEQILVVT